MRLGSSTDLQWDQVELEHLYQGQQCGEVPGMGHSWNVVIGESDPAEQIQSIKLIKGMKGKLVVFLYFLVFV